MTPNWVRGIDGRYYSAHEAANAVAMIPAVWLSDRVRVAIHAGIPVTTIALAVALVAVLSAATTYRAWTVCRQPERA